jgi:hypothetical protein
MRLLLGATLLAFAIGTGSARAQVGMVPGSSAARFYSGANSVYGAPGFYGTSYGVASYGVPRTYSTYNSPYGAGYGYGYPTPGFLPGRYGVNLWRPGFAAPGYVDGAPTGYRTFPARTWPSPTMYGPPFGVYAPGFGPAYPPMW